MAHRFGCPTFGPVVRVLIAQAAVLVISALVSNAAAQTTVLPGPAEPGVERRERTLPTPRAIPRLDIPAGEVPGQAPPGAEEVTLRLDQIVIDGVTAYEPEDLRPIYQDLLGRQVTLADVFAIAADITARYRNDGFILSRAIVPAQTIEGGTVQIAVVEGSVGTIIIDDPDGRDDRTRRLLDTFGERIQAARPIDIDTLERYLLLANDLPGITAEGVLSPSDGLLGASDLIIAVTRIRLEAFANVDNRGSRFVGQTRFQGGATTNGVLGFAERSGARLIVARDTRELRFAEILYEQPVGAEGLTAGVRATATRSDPGFTLAPLDAKNRTSAVELTTTFPVIRSRRRNIVLDGEFFYYNAKSDALSQRLSEDRLRALRFGATFDSVDSFLSVGVSIFQIEVSHGLDILGARKTGSADLSRAAGHSDFTKVNFEASRLQSLAPRWNLVVAATGQLSADPLLAVEEFCLGGSTFGRAYDACEIAGDHGIAARAELQFIAPLPITKLEPQLFAYYDLGLVWNKDSGTGTPARQSLASAGLGLRLNISELFSVEIEVAKPLTREVAAEGDDKARLFFNLVARF